MSQPSSPQPVVTPRRFSWRRLLQFRLRTLLVFVTGVAVGLAVGIPATNFSNQKPQSAQPLLTNGLQLRIVRHETDFMRGDNFIMTHGLDEFIFHNRGTAQVTMVFPPARIVEFTSITRRILPESDWPEFAKKPSTLTLAPQEKRVFHTNFSVATMDRKVPVLRFIFRIPTNQHSDFVDSVTSEGEWDTSKTKEYGQH